MPNTTPDNPTSETIAPENGAGKVLDGRRATARAEDLCRFIDASPMPHQAVAECIRRLEAAGFSELDEGEPWVLDPGAARYVVRAGTSIVALRVGTEAPADAGFALFGAHVDSPNLRIKPNPDRERFGVRQWHVDPYGGLIVATWLDRDLGLAGRVVVRGADGGTESRLLTIRRPLARIPNVAIHLNNRVNEDGLKVSKQDHLPPVVSMAGLGDPSGNGLRALLAAELDVPAGAIVDWDLGLFDVVPATLGGLRREMVFAPRLDNLGMSHAGLVALIEAPEKAPRTRVIALYDHEECGSTSVQGADGSFLVDTLARVVAAHPASADGGTSDTARAMARSFQISADMAHAVHPNRPELSEPAHLPLLNQGPAIKRNVNQRYATDGETGAWFTALCNAAGFEPQHYVHRSDMRCGSTIGPMSSARLGIRTVDVGNPMWSMHSIRETSGSLDHDLMIEATLQHFA